MTRLHTVHTVFAVGISLITCVSVAAAQQRIDPERPPRTPERVGNSNREAPPAGVRSGRKRGSQTRGQEAGRTTGEETDAERRARRRERRNRNTSNDDGGFARLLRRLGAKAPNGAGVIVAHVEAAENGGGFTPERDRASLQDVTFVGPAADAGTSRHATMVAERFYGTRGPATGVSTVYLWSADQLLERILGVGQNGSPPEWPGDVRVVCNAWVGQAGARTPEALARADFVALRDGVLFVSGLPNSGDRTSSPLLAQMKNGLAVGTIDSDHAGSALRPPGWKPDDDLLPRRRGNGQATPDAASRTPSSVPASREARTQPDGSNTPTRSPRAMLQAETEQGGTPLILASGSTTSEATPLVAAAATLLFDAAERSGQADAAHPPVIVAALLAGARHESSYAPAWSNGAIMRGEDRGRATAALDPAAGAGSLDVDAAHRILTGGRGTGAASLTTSDVAANANGPDGWAIFGGTAPQGDLVVRFDRPVRSFSVVATWPRIFTGDNREGIIDARLEILRLDDPAEDASPETPRATESLIGAPMNEVYVRGNVISDISTGNIEHCFVEGLAAGDYVIRVNRKANGDRPTPPAPIVIAWHGDVFTQFAPRAPGSGTADRNREAGSGGSDSPDSPVMAPKPLTLPDLPPPVRP